MSTHDRPARVGQEIQRVIGSALSRGMKDPRIGFVTVTGVKLSPDLREAVVYYSVMGSEAEHKSTQQGLEAAAGFFKREIARELKLRNIPSIRFSFDSSVETGAKIDELLKQARAKEGW